MARTQAADFEQRRQFILEKAAELFADRGFGAASIADLAAACKTSKSLVYHYYPSKEDILFAVMASHVDQLVEDVAAAQAADGPAEDRLRDLIGRFMRHYVGASDRQKVLLSELNHLPDAMRRQIVAQQRAVIDAVQSLLIAAVPGLAEDAAAARLRTMLLFGMINWTHTWYNPAGVIRVEDIARDAVNLALGKA